MYRGMTYSPEREADVLSRMVQYYGNSGGVQDWVNLPIDHWAVIGRMINYFIDNGIPIYLAQYLNEQGQPVHAGLIPIIEQTREGILIVGENPVTFWSIGESILNAATDLGMTEVVKTGNIYQWSGSEYFLLDGEPIPVYEDVMGLDFFRLVSLQKSLYPELTPFIDANFNLISSWFQNIYDLDQPVSMSDFFDLDSSGEYFLARTRPGILDVITASVNLNLDNYILAESLLMTLVESENLPSIAGEPYYWNPDTQEYQPTIPEIISPESVITEEPVVEEPVVEEPVQPLMPLSDNIVTQYPEVIIPAVSVPQVNLSEGVTKLLPLIELFAIMGV